MSTAGSVAYTALNPEVYSVVESEEWDSSSANVKRGADASESVEMVDSVGGPDVRHLPLAGGAGRLALE